MKLSFEQGLCEPLPSSTYLFMNLLRGLGVTERHSGQIFENGHFHSAVAPVQQRHQGARVHRPIHNLWPDTCRETKVKELIINVWPAPSQRLHWDQCNVENASQSREC